MDRRSSENAWSRRSWIILGTVLVLSAPAEGADWTGYAVIVGVADYPGTADDLYTCRDDATDLYNTLLSDPAHWSASNIKLLVDADATSDGIHTWLDLKFAQADELEGDVCLFYFSGHGTKVPDAAPTDESGAGEDGKDEALCPYDYATQTILDDDLADWLLPYSTAPTAKRICIILDTCYAGGMAKLVEPSTFEPWADGFAADVLASAQAARAMPKAGAAAKDISDTTQTGIVMLMACEEGQYSYEDPMLRHAVFTFYVVEALCRRAADTDASGFVSAGEAFTYAKPRTVAWNPGQVPQMYDALGAELDIITAGDRPLKEVVTPDDFPFGDSGGCHVGRPQGHRPGGGSSPGAAALGLLALLLLRRRRRRAPAALLLCAALSVGCLAPAYRAGAPGAEGESGETGAPRNMLRLMGGARAGLIAPFAEENASYRSAAQGGVFVGVAFPAGFEGQVGMDFFALEGEVKDVEGSVVSLRADAIFGPRDPSRACEPYFHAGPRLLIARASTYWGGGTAAAFGIGLGAGIRGGERGWDVRIAADALPWSGNMKGLWGITAGWSF